MKKYFLICNPGAKSFKGKKIIDIYKNLLEQKNVAFDFEYTKKRYHGIELTRNAIKSGYDVVVAVGGDGTINEVINGLCLEMTKSETVKFGVLYAGTSPDFCRYYGIPLDYKKAVDVLLNGNDKKINVGCITMKDNVSFYFASSVNIGLGAEVAEKSNRYRKYWGDFFGTLFATIISIKRHDYFESDLSIGDTKKKISKVLNMTIGINPLIASGLKLKIPQEMLDGKLYMFIVNGINKIDFIKKIPSVYSGKIVKDDRFILKFASEINVNTGTQARQVEFDGDEAGFCPCNISLKPGAISLIGGK